MARVFISYRDERDLDSKIGEACYLRLRALNHDVFLDISRLRPGEIWSQSIADNLARAEYFVALLSVEYLYRQGPVREEAISALTRRRDLKIIPINLAFDGDYPAPLAPFNEIQQIKWRGEADTATVVARVVAQLPAPYLLVRGLQSFDSSDEQAYAELAPATKIDACVALFNDSTPRFVLIHGISGAGKTSFVKAGVVPKLRASGHRVEVLVGRDPVDADVITLAAADILILDQFEQRLEELVHRPGHCVTLMRWLGSE